MPGLDRPPPPPGRQVVQEFLREAARPETRGPSSFRMSSLLQEMREIERARSQRRPVTAPNVALLAAAEPAVWAEQFSAAHSAQVRHGHWVLGSSRLPPYRGHWSGG